MKKILASFLLLLSAIPVLPQTAPLQYAASFSRDIKILEEFIPCYEGTESEARVSDIIEKRLTTIGVTFIKRSFSNSQTFHSFSRCIEAVIPGVSTDSVYIVFPINTDTDSKYSDTLVNVALGLALIAESASIKPRLTLHFLFMGAEFGDTNDYPLGSRIFLDDFFAEHPAVFLYMNFRTIPKRIILKAAANSIVSPHWLIIKSSETLQKSGLSFLLRGNKNQLFRMGFSDEKTKIEPYLKAEYPSLCFEGEYGEITSEETASWIKSFTGFFADFTNSFSNGFPGEWDKHYLFFQLFNFFIVFNEFALVLSIIVILLIFILCMTIFSQYFKQLLLIFVNKWWSLLFFMPLTFVFSMLSTGILNIILALKGDHEFFRLIPFPFLAFKVFLIVMFYMLLSPAIRKLSFPEDTRFYEKWSMLFLLLDIIIFSIVNISFSYYFLWAFVFVSLSLFITDRVLKFCLYAISPFWIVKLIADFSIVVPEYRFCSAFLLNPIYGNIILTLCLTPFILLGASVLLNLGVTLRKIKIEHIRLGMLISVVYSVCFLMVIFLLPGHSENQPQQVSVRDRIDMKNRTNEIEITSNTPLRGMTLWDDEDFYSFFTNSKKYTIPKRFPPALINVAARSKRFLARKNILVTISPEGKPHRINCILKSKEDFSLFDSNFPFTEIEAGRSYSLTIGINPPAPLTVGVTVPEAAHLSCDLQVDYLVFPFRFVATGRHKDIRTVLSVYNTIELDAAQN